VNLAAWLRRLGLERYEQAFRDHAVDVDILSELTEADFAELGVWPADREKLFEAITRLADSDQAKTKVARPATEGVGPDAELRQLT
jgi:predicted urease superfamily metal-dependent hydrolase